LRHNLNKTPIISQCQPEQIIRQVMVNSYLIGRNEIKKEEEKMLSNYFLKNFEQK